MNDFLPFATSTLANVQAQSEYIINAQRPVGFQEGTTAYSANINKVLRQATVFTSQLAQYLSDALDEDVLDDADFAALLAQFVATFAKWTGATDSTLTKAGNILGVAAAAITEPYLAANAVNSASIQSAAVTPAKRTTSMAAGFSGSFLTASTTFVDATDSGKISLVGGRPVLVQFQQGIQFTFPSNLVPCYLTATDAPSSALSVIYLRRHPNGTIPDVQIAAQTIDVFSASFSFGPPWQVGPAQLKCVDLNPPAGTWIYVVRARKTTTAHAGSVGWSNVQLMALEL